jgi:hypothetical protein
MLHAAPDQERDQDLSVICFSFSVFNFGCLWIKAGVAQTHGRAMQTANCTWNVTITLAGLEQGGRGILRPKLHSFLLDSMPGN